MSVGYSMFMGLLYLMGGYTPTVGSVCSAANQSMRASPYGATKIASDCLYGWSEQSAVSKNAFANSTSDCWLPAPSPWLGDFFPRKYIQWLSMVLRNISRWGAY